MTAQISETLLHEGQKLVLYSTPLCQCKSFNKKAKELLINCTGLWRGYVGEWVIIDGRLYLTNISARLKNNQRVSLDYFFPGYSNLVFAHWYSGILKIMLGKCINYVHMGFCSQYEQEWQIAVEGGIVVNEQTIFHSADQQV